jgi:hypothetical protein
VGPSCWWRISAGRGPIRHGCAPRAADKDAAGTTTSRPSPQLSWVDHRRQTEDGRWVKAARRKIDAMMGVTDVLAKLRTKDGAGIHVAVAEALLVGFKTRAWSTRPATSTAATGFPSMPPRATSDGRGRYNTRPARGRVEGAASDGLNGCHYNATETTRGPSPASFTWQASAYEAPPPARSGRAFPVWLNAARASAAAPSGSGDLDGPLHRVPTDNGEAACAPPRRQGTRAGHTRMAAPNTPPRWMQGVKQTHLDTAPVSAGQAAA